MPDSADIFADRTAGDRTAVPLWRFYAYFLRLGAAASAARLRSPASCSATWSKTGVGSVARTTSTVSPWRSSRPARWPRSSRYLGYVRAGVLGATMVSVCFILPSFLMVWAISVAYVRFGGLAWMQALFYGVGAAVIGIIVRSAHKLTRLTLARMRCSGRSPP